MANETIYFIRLGKTNLYKLGFTRHLVHRLTSLDNNAPYPIQLCASYQSEQAADMEHQLHHKYVKHRTYGEWYKFARKQAKEIIAALHINGNNPDVLDI